MNAYNYISFDVSPDGRKIVVSSGKGKLFLYDLTTKTTQAVPIDRDIARFPRFSANGERVVYVTFPKGPPGAESEADERGTELRQFLLRDLKVRPLFPPSGMKETRPFFFRDSDRVGFVRAHVYRDYRSGGKIWDKADFYVVDPQGGAPVRVTNDNFYGSGLFPADGLQSEKRILFSQAWLHDGAIYFADATTGKTGIWRTLRRKDGDALAITELACSRNDNVIVLVADYDVIFNFNLYLLDAKTRRLSLRRTR